MQGRVEVLLPVCQLLPALSTMSMRPPEMVEAQQVHTDAGACLRGGGLGDSVSIWHTYLLKQAFKRRTQGVHGS